MEAHTRQRPGLRPLWTGREQHRAYTRPSPSSVRSPLYSSALREGFFSPLYPASPNNEQTTRGQEPAVAERLGQHGGFDPRDSPATTPRSLSPISEHTLSARRGSVASLPLPSAPAPSPRSPGFATLYPMMQTLVAETRSILLDGLPDGLPRPQPRSADTATERRQSLPSSFPAARRSSQQLQQELQAWGHVYFGNGSQADCFVCAVALRRPSSNSPTDGSPAAGGGPADGKNKITYCALVRPRILGRKAFKLSRTFDVDELRATVPELSPLSACGRRNSIEPSSRSSVPARRRRSTIAAGVDHGLGLDRWPARTRNTFPIRMSSSPSPSAPPRMPSSSIPHTFC